MMQQRGGTLVGFIIGVLVGLGAALAVAVYVTKVPVPFLNKGQSRTVEQDAEEARKNKDWDPNAPLYGKNPAKPAAPAASAASAPASAQVAPAALPAAAASAPAARAELKPAVTGDPRGDLAKARAGAPATAPAAAAEPFNYFVQVGAFRTPEDAESQRARLSLTGLEARVSEREQSGRMVYRVRVGPFDKREDADRAKEKLDASGVETVLVRVQR
jgi:cell division protein FtsN